MSRKQIEVPATVVSPADAILLQISALRESFKKAAPQSETKAVSAKVTAKVTLEPVFGPMSRSLNDGNLRNVATVFAAVRDGKVTADERNAIRASAVAAIAEMAKVTGRTFKHTYTVGSRTYQESALYLAYLAA